MCWQCYKDKFQLKKAETKIECYKVVKIELNDSNYCIKSFFQNTTYKIGNLFHSDISIDSSITTDKLYVNEAIHSYSILPTLKYDALAVNNYTDYYFIQEPIVMKCFIPEGAMYAINSDNEIVSSDIRMDSIVPIEELKLRSTTNPYWREIYWYRETYKKIHNLVLQKEE
jgi:hypothetical protein